MERLLIENVLDERIVENIQSTIITCSTKGLLTYQLSSFIRIDVNEKLARELLLREKNRLKVLIDDVFFQVFDIRNQRVILENFEILFDPEYKLDVLKFLEKLGNRGKVIAVWPGIYKENLLIYSEPQYHDYAKYNLCDYNITLIVERG